MASKTEQPEGGEQAPVKTPRKFDKATILASTRWKERDLALLLLALKEGQTYTMDEAQAALEAMDKKAVK